MKVETKGPNVHVHLNEFDVNAFNAQQHTSIPVDPEYDKIIFSFSRLSGELLRVIPNATRNGGVSWERLRDFARSHIPRI